MIWRKHLIALGIVAVAILGLFHRDAIDMADKWWNISTYGHCLLLPLIIAWLVSERRAELAAITPTAWWPGLIGLAGAGFLWMLGEAAGISLFRHAALIFMLQAATVTLLGHLVARGLLFPIFYASFLIPFGEEAVPLMQTITAKMSMVMLGWAGVPAHIEGVFITIPTGLFEVAEACSGIKFLVAMAAFSTLAANLCFKSWRRRAAFLVMAMIVPVFANGVRAFATIYVSHVTGNNDFASSFDHVIFGWVFFGIVMALVMGLAWRFFDRKAGDPFVGANMAVSGKAGSLPVIASASVGLIIGMIALQAFLASLGQTALPNAIELPQVKGWTRSVAHPSFAWEPRFDGADHRLTGHYVSTSGDQVDLVVVLFGWQAEDKEIVGFGQGLIAPESGWSWAHATQAPGAGKADLIFAPGAEREVASFYHIGGQTTGSSTIVKLETLKARLLGGDQVAAAVLVSTEDMAQRRSRPQIDAFLRDLGPVDDLVTGLINQSRGIH
ncbi:MAG: exosortase [Pseudomonadota bacterium]|jgi:exosortase A